MKRLTKRLWYGSDTEKDKDGNIIATAPPVAVDDGSEDWHLKGLVRGEIYLNDNIYDPSLFCLGNDGLVKKIGGGSGGGGGSVIVNIDITQGDGISINKNIVGEQLIYKVSHKDTSSVKSTSNVGTFIINNLSFDDFGHVTEVSNINAADLFDDRYLRKDIDDTAHGNILFDKKIGSSIFLDGYDGKGWEITGPGAALLDSAKVRSDIYIGGKFGSPSFASGFTGWGVEIDIPTAAGTFDFLTVRKSMKVYELVYSQIYGLGGSVIISDLNKILYVEICQGFYRCYMDSMDGTMRMNLRKDDIVRMQRSSGINIRYFYGEVLKVTPDYFDLKVTDGEDYPQFGDVVFRFGNKTDKNRQGIIYLTSSDDKAPYIDILDGITDSSMFEKIKVRLGNLSGIRTKHGVQLNGYGIYAQGAVFENSEIYLEDGTTVSQQFIVMDGKFNSTIEGIRNDMSVESGNILKNSSFGTNLNYWKSTDDISFINMSGSFLWMDGSFYSEKRSVADIYRDGSKNVLRILETTIVQNNDVLTGSKTEGSYSFSFYYKVLRSGTLSIGFPGKELFITESLSASEGYEKMSKVATWDGTGDFSIAFTGEILIYSVSLFNDALADATIKLQTQIDQTEEYIKLLATKEYVDDETGKVYIRYDASLTVMATEIAARVTKTDFDTETGAIRQEVSSQLSIQAGRISAISTDVNNISHTIDTAGWINTTQGNMLFASHNSVDTLTGRVSTAESSISNNAYSITQKVSSIDYNGKEIISKVNQTASTYQIDAKNINLYGKVTISMFDTTLRNDFNAKANTSSLKGMAFENMVTKAKLDSTIMEGGYIKTSLIQTKDLVVSNVSNLGNFTVAGNMIENAATGMLIDATGAISFNQNFMRFASVGTRTTAGSLGGTALLNLYDRNTGYEGTDSKIVALLGIGRSRYADIPQTWLICRHEAEAGWGSQFIVQSRYFNDANGMERTCINLGQFSSATQLESAGLATKDAWKPVYWNTVSGALGWY